MTQHYSNPQQESDPGALPDLEIFYVYPGGPAELRLGSGTPKGWYWQRHRTDGDLLAHLQTVGDVIGPFATEWEALADAREGVEDEDDEDPPSAAVVLSALESAIEQVCDQDTQNAINDAYSALIEKWRRGVVRKDGSS